MQKYADQIKYRSDKTRDRYGQAIIVDEVNASSQSMLQVMESISTISMVSSGNTQHVAAAADEHTASMEEITTLAITLSKMAEEL